MAALQALPHPRSPHLSLRRGKAPVHSKIICSSEKATTGNDISRHAFSCLSATLILLSPASKVLAAEQHQHYATCQLATIADNNLMLKLDDESGNGPAMIMMRGMTAKNFDPERYAGRWFEVASLKRGFAGQGQEDCHCTQGVYTYDPKVPAIQVDTFCVHGGPDGYITGIRGKVQCLADKEMVMTETGLEGEGMSRGKCFLRFPTLPFIPKEPYDVFATDYDNYALVSGAKDKNFVQIYSRTPNPGAAFIDKYKNYLADLGYNRDQIKDTPQDCEVMSSSELALMMSMPGMQETLTNQFPELGLKGSVAFDPFSSVFETFKKLVELYFKQLFS